MKSVPNRIANETRTLISIEATARGYIGSSPAGSAVWREGGLCHVNNHDKKVRLVSVKAVPLSRDHMVPSRAS